VCVCVRDNLEGPSSVGSLPCERSIYNALLAEQVRRARLEDFSPSETFDIGVALHACGPATDLSLECCLQAGITLEQKVLS